MGDEGAAVRVVRRLDPGLASGGAAAGVQVRVEDAAARGVHQRRLGRAGPVAQRPVRGPVEAGGEAFPEAVRVWEGDLEGHGDVPALLDALRDGGGPAHEEPLGGGDARRVRLAGEAVAVHGALVAQHPVVGQRMRREQEGPGQQQRQRQHCGCTLGGRLWGREVQRVRGRRQRQQQQPRWRRPPPRPRP